MLDVLLEHWDFNLQVVLSAIVTAGAVALASQGSLCNFSFNSWSLLDLLDEEDLVLVELLVHGEFAGLSEGLGATLIWALEWFLPCVDVRVFFQVLC